MTPIALVYSIRYNHFILNRSFVRLINFSTKRELVSHDIRGTTAPGRTLDVSAAEVF
jgi:hypothetical protein